MKKNMGSVDRILRTLVAVILVILVLTGGIKGILAYVLVAVAIVFLATSLLSFCPLYGLLRINTLGRKKSEQ